MKKKRVLALIGAGYWGKNLARNFDELGVLHSICDRNASVTTQHAKKYPHIHFYSNYKETILDPNVQSVAIATNSETHYDIAEFALKHDKDVFIEKPMCLHLEEAEKLVKIADNHRKILMVGHILQYHPCIMKIRELLQEGALGQLYRVVSSRLDLGTIRTEENALWEFMPHDLSVLLSLIDDFPSEVRCLGKSYLNPNIEDFSLLSLGYSNNVSAQIYASWMNPEKVRKLTIIGSKGMIVFDDILPWNQKLTLYRNPFKKNGLYWEANQLNPEPVLVDIFEPLKEECRHFIECTENRNKPKTDGKEGLRVLKVLHAAQSSLDQNGSKICLRVEEPALSA